MKPVTQSRTGENGTCFRACVASILELPEATVPDWPDANLDPDVNQWLGQRGLRYEQIDASAPPPLGLHIIQGLSPRGGQHAIVGKDGRPIWDPHPQDGTGRFLVRKDEWGVLLPIKSEAKDSMLSGLALQAAITPVYTRHNEIKATPRRSWQEVSKLLGETKALLDASRISDKAKWQTVLAHASSFLAMARDAERQGDNPHFVGWTERAFMMTHHVLDVLESLARRTAARDEANAPYGPGDLIKLPNGKITEVTKCLLGEDLFHEPEYHVSTKTGECVVVPVKARSKDRRAPARLHRALDAVLDGRK